MSSATPLIGVALLALRVVVVLLLALFIVLKLTGAIAWSWWWVFSALWIPLGLAGLVWLFILARPSRS